MKTINFLCKFPGILAITLIAELFTQGFKYPVLTVYVVFITFFTNMYLFFPKMKRGNKYLLITLVPITVTTLFCLTQMCVLYTMLHYGAPAEFSVGYPIQVAAVWVTGAITVWAWFAGIWNIIHDPFIC